MKSTKNVSKKVSKINNDSNNAAITTLDFSSNLAASQTCQSMASNLKCVIAQLESDRDMPEASKVLKLMVLNKALTKFSTGATTYSEASAAEVQKYA